jgi:hypothetical protein
MFSREYSQTAKNKRRYQFPAKADSSDRQLKETRPVQPRDHFVGCMLQAYRSRLSLVGQSQNRTYPCKLTRVEANHNYSWLQSRRPHGLFLLSSRVHACSKPARTVSNPGPPRSCRLGLLARMMATATPIAGDFGSVRQSNPKAIGDVYLPASLPRPPVSTPVFWAMPI